ncbi:hypothetical protein AB8E32_07020 [Marinomonas polaris]|uniref:hypothetical protein n=1 Tax=Marinomonas polaris TaxID=293552 RepID=UPI003511E354
MTNEQAVVDAGKEIAHLKSCYITFIMPIVVEYQKNGTEPLLAQLLECQRLGNEYFNYVERFVGDSDLLGAHAKGKWVTGLAEDCKVILESYLIHAEFILSWRSKLGSHAQPASSALSNMQRMVLEYLPKDQSASLKSQFENKNLPIQGFNMPAKKDKIKIPKWQLITSVSIGCVALIASVIIALAVPTPTTYQVFILRGLFAIALASIASIIPGFLNLETGANSKAAYFGIYAGGAIAIFVLIWLFNPPEIGPKKSDVQPAFEQSS